MNLEEAFSVLAKSGCHLKAEAGGGIVLDVPPGGPSVPRAVLDVLAAHRESLVAVLAPAKPSPVTEAQPRSAGPTSSSGRPSPYARDLGVALAQKPTLPAPALNAAEMLARARAAKAALRAKQAVKAELAETATEPSSPYRHTADTALDPFPF